jgi:hypothetical protein
MSPLEHDFEKQNEPKMKIVACSPETGPYRRNNTEQVFSCSQLPQIAQE